MGRGSLGQSVTEFALVLPIILTLVLGVFELGRVVFIFSSLNNATREAARFGAATGFRGGLPAYLNCSAIRQHARDTAFLADLTDGEIQIAYDTPDGDTMAVFEECSEDLDPAKIRPGDRIVITVNKTVKPILPVLPTDGFNLSFVTARTILKNIVIGPVACSDGFDNDGDGLIDMDDPGCSSPDDTTEAFCYSLFTPSVPPQGGSASIRPDPNCANRYIERTPVTLTANPAEPEYLFIGWFDNETGVEISTDDSLDVVMDEDKGIEARFRLRTSDLHVEKDAPATVYAESPLAYEIVVTNAYSDTAHDVVITDTLPADLQLQSWSIDAGGECPTATETQFICQVAELPMNGKVTLTIDVLSPNTNYSSKTITNTVEASAFEFDPDLSNNTATATTDVLPRIGLSIAKEDSEDPVVAGTQYDYTVTVGNSGPSVATGVVATDTLPSAVTLVSAPDYCLEVEPNVLRCDIGDILVGASTSFIITVQAPDNPGAGVNEETVTNAATVSANEFDSLGSSTTSENTTIVREADLRLIKEAPTSAYRDVAFVYDIFVDNFGVSEALDVQVVDELPAGVDYNGFSSSVGDPDVCSFSSNIVTCNLGALASGATAWVKLDVTPTIDEGTLENRAAVSSTTNDPGPAVNEDTATTTVSTDVALTISKSASADAVSEGDDFFYTINVENNGASNAYNVNVEDTLPAGVEFTGATTAGSWGCNGPPATTVTCAPADGIFVGGTRETITINVTAVDAGSFPNTASLNSDDGNKSSEEITVTVNPKLDVSVGVSAPDSASVGDTFDYTFSVHNSGPSEATGVVLTNTLDEDVTVDVNSVTPNGMTCDPYDDVNNQLVCEADAALAGGDSVSVKVTVTVASTATDSVTSGGAVTFTESGYDTDPSNNDTSKTTTITTTTIE